MKKPWIKCGIIGSLAVIIFVIVVPIIINECYKANSGYMTIWGAADVLSYYGTIIAAAGAAIGVFFSIKYSHRQYREDKRRDVLPYFIIDVFDRKCIEPFDIGWYDKDIDEEQDKAKDALTYKEFNNTNHYFVFKEGKISYCRKLTKEQEDDRTISMTGEDGEKSDGICENNNFYIPLEIKNVGKGCAINMTIATELCCKRAFAESLPVPVPVGKGIYVGLLFYIDNGLADTYDFIIRYSDIYSNMYGYQKLITTGTENNRSIQIAEETVHILMREAKI